MLKRSSNEKPRTTFEDTEQYYRDEELELLNIKRHHQVEEDKVNNFEDDDADDGEAVSSRFVNDQRIRYSTAQSSRPYDDSLAGEDEEFFRTHYVSHQRDAARFGGGMRRERQEFEDSGPLNRQLEEMIQRPPRRNRGEGGKERKLQSWKNTQQ